MFVRAIRATLTLLARRPLEPVTSVGTEERVQTKDEPELILPAGACERAVAMVTPKGGWVFLPRAPNRPCTEGPVRSS